MRDEWTKELPDERTVIYTSKFVPGNGGVIAAHVSELVRTPTVQVQVTREEVDAQFKNL